MQLFTYKGRYAVDADLSKFFDTVNHDVLMRCVETRVKDKGAFYLQCFRAGWTRSEAFGTTDRKEWQSCDTTVLSKLMGIAAILAALI